jgi:hypothetical protein
VTDDRHPHDESSQNVAEQLMGRVSDATARVGDVGHAIVEGVQERVEQVTSHFRRDELEPSQVGQPIPSDIRPVRPKKGSSMWLAWRGTQWAPVHRVKDVGWVWSE